MHDSQRFPHSEDSPYLSYPEDLWAAWFESHERDWEKRLGFSPTLDQRALFSSQSRAEYTKWFEKTIAPRNVAEQKRWIGFLAERWKELGTSLGTEPYLTPEQHVSWRAAQRGPYETERNLLAKSVRGVAKYVGSAIRDRQVTAKSAKSAAAAESAATSASSATSASQRMPGAGAESNEKFTEQRPAGMLWNVKLPKSLRRPKP